MQQIVSQTKQKTVARPHFLKVLDKAFRVLAVMARSQSGVRVSELARSLQLPKATVFRILYTLQEIGHARKDPLTRAYHATQDIPWLSHDEARQHLNRVARPYMVKLLTRFEQTVNLAVLDLEQVLYTEIREGLRSIRMSATVNTYAPAHATAIGKSMLAFFHPIEAEAMLRKRPLIKLTPRTMASVPGLLKEFERIRLQGYALDDEESEIGARCVAAPIFNSERRPIAAISISGPVSHVTAKSIRKITPVLTKATRDISLQFGYRPLNNRKRHAPNG